MVHTPMSEMLKNTLITELIWLTGAATQTFAPGGKHCRAATGFEMLRDTIADRLNVDLVRNLSQIW